MTRLILGIAALAGIFAAVALGLPSHVTVSRAVVINAPESAIFPYLNNLHQFGDWSPWKARDPELAVSYGGPESGQGARVTWSSKKPSIGMGSMEIGESQPSRHIDLVVNFNGLDGTSSYDVMPSGSGSKVIWTFGYDSGTNPLKRWKALMLDGLVGAEYRNGLELLREKVEADRRPTMPTMVPAPQQGVTIQPEQPAAPIPPGAPVPPGAAPQAGAPAATAAPQPDAAPAAQPSQPPATSSAAPKKKKRPQ
ncbi:MAG TPA: SRPBCC family protein [Methyloceanibacter sp.]|nr:SRPBCC family protein [Methyloceanibacter sp.]